ncbi:MAG: protein kinase, partial [Planctomycetota bacterium]
MTSVDQKFVDYIVSKGWATSEQIDACRAELTSQIEMSGIQNQTLKGLLIHKKILSPAQVAEALAVDSKPSATSGEPSKSKPKNVYLGRWHIVEKLGSGAMGQVFKGVHEETGQVAAIKVLPKDRAESDEFRQRFMREAKAAVKLQHPHIVSGYEVDVR